MRGLSFILPGELRLQGLSLTIGPDGEPSVEPGTPLFRTDIWPQWAHEAIEGAVEARTHADGIPAAIIDPIDSDQLAALVLSELRASMRSLCATAFAVDGFYGAIKTRSSLASDATSDPRLP